MSEQQSQKKARKLVQAELTDRAIEEASILLAFDKLLPQQEHTFEKPVTVPVQMKEAYEEHRKDLALKAEEGLAAPLACSEEFGELLIQGRREQQRQEERASALRQMRLPKRDRKNPLKNVELMLEKEIIVEN